jgi:hypothetical protein
MSISYGDLRDVLRASLLDLLYELRETDVRLILGGGFGIYLKWDYLRRSGARCLIDVIPQARSTKDLDFFLHTALLADSRRAKLLAEALERLGYRVVPGRECYQFEKEVSHQGHPQPVRIDLLTREPVSPERARLEVKRIQVKPKSRAGIHAYRTEAALAVEDSPIELVIKGSRSSGEAFHAPVFLPQPFSYCVLKLFAFRDQHQDEHERRDRGRHHALDLYSLIAMMTEEEYETSLALSRKYREEEAVREARRIVRDCFSGPSEIGMIRMQEHGYFTSDLDLDQFRSVLVEFFPPD